MIQTHQKNSSGSVLGGRELWLFHFSLSHIHFFHKPAHSVTSGKDRIAFPSIKTKFEKNRDLGWCPPAGQMEKAGMVDKGRMFLYPNHKCYSKQMDWTLVWGISGRVLGH